MSKGNKTGKGKVHMSAKYLVRDSATGAASLLSAVMYRKMKANSRVTAVSQRVVVTKRAHGVPTVARHPTPFLLDPYDWGPEGVPRGEPIRYVPGQGFVVED